MMAKHTNRIHAAHLNKAYLFITAIVALVAVGDVLKAKAAEPAARPNILYFYVDDMGWGAIGPNGQAARKEAGMPYVKTPNLDRLAAQGINFTRGYGCHVCSPARSSQQTGFHQGHTFADRNDPNNAKKAMRRDDLCIGDVLSAAGYTTGYWGKWGYGGSATMTAPVIENVQTLPTSHGYQHVLAELHHVRAHTFFQPTLWSAPVAKKAKGGLALIPNSLAAYESDRYPNTPAYQNDGKYPKTAYCDDHYAMAALEFVRQQGMNYNKTGKPFCGILAAQIPHAPFGDVATLPNWDKAYADDPHFATLAKQTQQWAAMVTRIDAHFGNILAALDDPNGDGDTSDSVAANTLVIFQSDNGGPSGANNKELDANGGLRGVKGNIQEGGIRVPLIMRWPAKINAESKLKPGDNCDRVVDVTDLLPTFCELAGVAAPVGIDGVSIAPMLQNRGKQRMRDFLIHEAGNGQSIIRGRYKLVRSVMSRKNRKKKEEPQTQLKLYDLVADPTESNDISATSPELLKELQTSLIGERVTEPRGFANTYHHWQGKDGANISDAENWSDYRYENDHVVYMTDAGAPHVAWTALMKNKGNRPNTANVDKDTAFLGLELQGAAETAKQTLVVKPGVTLTGRNEIRLSAHSTLEVNDGTVSSLRWIDVMPNATLSGNGEINATIYNNGTVSVNANESSLHIGKGYHQFVNGKLEFELQDAAEPAICIQGNGSIAGELVITTPTDFKPVVGKLYPIIAANKIDGSFANENDEVVASDGSRFTIHYTNSTVSISKTGDLQSR